MKTPRKINDCLVAAVRNLTDGSCMSDKVRAALLEDEAVAIYLKTWVIPNLTQIRDWNEGLLSHNEMTVMGGRF